MKRTKSTSIFIFILVMVFSLTAFGQKKEIHKTFSGKKKVKIKLILGDCKLVKSKNDKIDVFVTHSYDDSEFEAQFKEKSSSLTIKEELHDPDGGSSFWTIALPEEVTVDFNSATGDLEIVGLNADVDGNSGTGDISIKDSEGEFDLNSGTGDMEVSNSKGEFDVNSGTGNVMIEKCSGEFDANSGTGDVEAKGITIIDEADFNSGTGEVTVYGPKGNGFDLSLNSGTDDAILDMDGQPIDGFFQFSAHARKGDIDSPIAFDREEEHENGDGIYMKKSFTRGNSKNRYFIGTGTGTAKLVK